MRAVISQYAMSAPKDLKAALRLLAAERGRYRVFAGGTDLMVLLEAGALPPGEFLSLWHLAELRGIKATKDFVTLGALTTYSDTRGQAVLAKEFPLLGSAARETGAIAIQNRGTLGGNIANASPAADTPPALLVYGAEVELVSTEGSRWVAYDGFHTAYKKTVMAQHEIIRAVRVPRGTKWRGYYRKVGTRRAQAISKVCFAGGLREAKGTITDVRIALGSVAPIPLRAKATESFLVGKKRDRAVAVAAGEQLLKEISPIDDIRSDATYRRTVAANLLIEFLCGIG